MEYKISSQPEKLTETTSVGRPVIRPISTGIKKSGLSLFGATLATVFVFSFFLIPFIHSAHALTNAEICISSGGDFSSGSCSCPSTKIPSSYPGGGVVCLLKTATQIVATPTTGVTASDQDNCQEQGEVAVTGPDGNTICISPEASQAVNTNTTAVTSEQYTAATGVDSTGNSAETNAIRAAEEANKKLDGECGTAFWQTLMNPVDCWLPGIVNWILGLSAYLLWMAGSFLNYSAVFTLNLSSFASKLNIDATWATIRDLMNIVFIFALLWVSINTVLGLGNDAKKLLASIIISALLINFSLFFTKVVVDVSNVVALQFYTGITGGKFLSPDSPLDGDISGQFMARLKLTSIYNAGPSASNASGRSTGLSGAALDEVATLTMGNVVTSGIMGTIFIIITAFVFFTAGLMLAARSAVLVILMVTSPIGFIGGFIPKLATYTKKWQEELTNQALFAPIFFMLIWMVLKMTESSVTETGSVSFATAIAGGNATFISVIFNYVILIAFIVAALMVAKDMSGKAGGAFAKFGGVAVGAVAGGMGGWALRKGVGSLSQMAARSERLKDWSEREGASGVLGRMALSTAKFGQNTSFDVRALGDTKLGKAAGYVAEQTGVGVDFGKAGGVGGRKATYDRQIKEKEEARKKQADELKTEKLDMLANPTGDATITAENTRREGINTKLVAAEKARLVQFAQRTREGTTLDKVKKYTTLSKVAVRGSTKAAAGVAKDLKKREDQMKELDNRGKRVRKAIADLSLTDEAEVVEHYEKEIEAAETLLAGHLASGSVATQLDIEKAEKNLNLQKGKLSKFENDRKERDRLGEVLGKKPDAPKTP